MLNVSASCGSPVVGIVTESGLAPVSIMLCRPSTPWIPAPLCTSTNASAGSASMPSSLTNDSSPFASSDVLDVDLCCRIEGLRDLLPVAVGRTMGCIGAEGVAGESGCDMMPAVCNVGSIEGNLSTSRTGRIENPSVVSIEGTAVANGCIIFIR